MMKKTEDKQSFLMTSLLLSGGLNIILVALIFYFIAKETPPRPYYELKPAGKNEEHTPLAFNLSTQEAIFRFRPLSFDQLVVKLNEKDLVDNGFSVRDLALSTLVFFHHLDLEKALKGLPQPQEIRKIPLGKDRKGEIVEIEVYQNLSDKQYAAIIEFATKEAFPITNKGLYFLLRKQKEFDINLLDTFYLTPEFLSAEMLLNRGDSSIEREQILKLLLQGSWKYLALFTEQQRLTQDLSDARRQRFLLDYLEAGSSQAAFIILKTDGPFAAKKLDDIHIELILKMLNQKSDEGEKFAKVLLTSPRSDSVWKLAAEKLYQFNGEELPETNIHHEALLRFVGQKSSPNGEKIKKVAIKAPAEKAPITKSLKSSEIAYVVLEGDSLWKIAKKFKVSVDKLKAYNHLQSDFLKPGSTLKIPAK